ncbi:MAG TPA: DEDD exonuclease domain-containing protein [Actinomycetota bacterium]
MLAEPIQTTLDQGVPLDQVEFCVVDLETTGGSPRNSRITEVGAVRYLGGQRLGSFQSLVNPCEHIPARIAHLTGIDDRLVAREPPIEQVLPAFLEFARGATIVAHNARFDFAFLNENLATLDYPVLPGPPVCTARLARRIVWPDVPNVKLRTLAEYFRTRVKPIHRALDDADACAEVLHGLLALGGRLGIRTLGDLHEVVRAKGRPNFGKIHLADALPHATGVYVFRGREGQVLYVGKSNDLRTRVKSYFYGDERKKVERLLEEIHTVEGIECQGELEALVVEARLIRTHEPPYNRRGKGWRKGAYLKLDPAEAYPRLKVVYTVKPDDGCRYLGPFAGAARAREVKDALESVVPIRRCTASMRRTTRFAPCVLADMNRCLAPCDGRTDPERYGELVRGLVSSLTASPGGLLEALERQMDDLATQERYEQAALVRDRLGALATALHRDRHDAWIVGAGHLDVSTADGSIMRFDHGALLTAAGPSGDPRLSLPCSRDRADELAAVRSWLQRHPGSVLRADVAPAEPVDGGAVIARVLAQRHRSQRSERRGATRSTPEAARTDG